MNERLSSPTRLIGCVVVCALAGLFAPTSRAETNWQSYEIILPVLNPNFSPLAAENRPLLYDRLIMAFARDHIAHELHTQGRTLNDGMAVYYLQRELQALLDMWQATGYTSYLDQASSLAQQAIKDASASPRMLIWHDEPRGEWPCFYLESVLAKTGGHNQLCDFQGGAGFLMVARALQQVNRPDWQPIADFVEHDVVKKWLYYKPSITEEQVKGPESGKYLLVILNSGRDVREHFACICLDLDALGYRNYPYREWASLLIDLYLTPRYEPNQPAPYQDKIPDRIPADWGLLAHADERGYVWMSVPSYDPNSPTDALDTSHANRTAWLAAKACTEGLVSKSVVAGLANTLRFRIWAPEKGPLYFNNYVDGTDADLNGLSAGRGGNIWFGWHRLAAFDPDLQDLFLSVAYDLSNGGPNLPEGAQNKTMQDAPLCLEAWGVRLLSTKSQPFRFP